MAGYVLYGRIFKTVLIILHKLHSWIHLVHSLRFFVSLLFLLIFNGTITIALELLFNFLLLGETRRNLQVHSQPKTRITSCPKLVVDVDIVSNLCVEKFGDNFVIVRGPTMGIPGRPKVIYKQILPLNSFSFFSSSGTWANKQKVAKFVRPQSLNMECRGTEI